MSKSYIKSHKLAKPIGTRNLKNRNILDTRLKNAKLELMSVIKRSEKWRTNKPMLLADAIIGICAKHGMRIETVINSFLRRSLDANTRTAIAKRLAFLGRQNKK